MCLASYTHHLAMFVANDDDDVSAGWATRCANGHVGWLAWGMHMHQPKPLPSRKRTLSIESLDQDAQKDGHAQCLGGPAEYFASHPGQAWALGRFTQRFSLERRLR